VQERLDAAANAASVAEIQSPVFPNRVPAVSSGGDRHANPPLKIRRKIDISMQTCRSPIVERMGQRNFR
jgi:hypothetical protein